jgi:hypothetical protein
MTTRNFKGAPTLRVLIWSSLIILMVVYSFVFFAGGYLHYNGGIPNSTLETQYQAIAGNTANPNGGIFGNLQGLDTQLTQQGSNYSQSSGTGVSIGGIVGTVSAFFNTVPAILNSVLFMVGSVFSYVGIPTSYFVLIGTIMIIALIVIAIITIISVVYV